MIFRLIFGKPPLSEYKPMQAMFMIPKNPPPKIPEYIIEQLNFSNEFIEFIGKCLQKNPAMRPSAEMVINDKWVKKVENDYMSELLVVVVVVMVNRNQVILLLNFKILK